MTEDSGRDSRSIDYSTTPEIDIVHLEGVATEQFETCETAVRKLMEPLGAVEDFGAYVLADDEE